MYKQEPRSSPAPPKPELPKGPKKGPNGKEVATPYSKILLAASKREKASLQKNEKEGSFTLAKLFQ